MYKILDEYVQNYEASITRSMSCIARLAWLRADLADITYEYTLLHFHMVILSKAAVLETRISLIPPSWP